MKKCWIFIGLIMILSIGTVRGDPQITASIKNGYVGSPDNPDIATVTVEVVGIQDVLNYTNFKIKVGDKEGKIVLILHGKYNVYDHYYDIKFIPPKVDVQGEYDVNVSILYDGKVYSYVIKNGLTYGTENVDVALIIDSSGSMRGNDPNNIRKAGAKLLVDKLDNGDAVTVVDFDDSVRVWMPLKVIYNESDKEAIKKAIDKVDSNGGTIIEGGLNEGYKQLNSSTTNNRKVAILLTDGENNEPFDYSVLDNYKKDNIPVYTIALTGSADEELLKKIASETGGVYKKANVAEDLLKIYNYIKKSVKGDTTLWEANGTLNPNENITYYINIPPTMKYFEVTMFGSQDLNIYLFYPNGTMVELNASSPTGTNDNNIEFVNTTQYKLYKVNNPVSGKWMILITAGSIGGEYRTIVTGKSYILIDSSHYIYQNGDLFDILITANIYNKSSGNLINNANVFVNITYSDNISQTYKILFGRNDELFKKFGVNCPGNIYYIALNNLSYDALSYKIIVKLPDGSEICSDSVSITLSRVRIVEIYNDKSYFVHINESMGDTVKLLMKSIGDTFLLTKNDEYWINVTTSNIRLANISKLKVEIYDNNKNLLESYELSCKRVIFNNSIVGIHSTDSFKYTGDYYGNGYVNVILNNTVISQKAYLTPFTIVPLDENGNPCYNNPNVTKWYDIKLYDSSLLSNLNSPSTERPLIIASPTYEQIYFDKIGEKIFGITNDTEKHELISQLAIIQVCGLTELIKKYPDAKYYIYSYNRLVCNEDNIKDEIKYITEKYTKNGGKVLIVGAVPHKSVEFNGVKATKSYDASYISYARALNINNQKLWNGKDNVVYVANHYRAEEYFSGLNKAGKYNKIVFGDLSTNYPGIVVAKYDKPLLQISPTLGIDLNKNISELDGYATYKVGTLVPLGYTTYVGVTGSWNIISADLCQDHVGAYLELPLLGRCVGIEAKRTETHGKAYFYVSFSGYSVSLPVPGIKLEDTGFLGIKKPVIIINNEDIQIIPPFYWEYLFIDTDLNINELDKLIDQKIDELCNTKFGIPSFGFEINIPVINKPIGFKTPELTVKINDFIIYHHKYYQVIDLSVTKIPISYEIYTINVPTLPGFKCIDKVPVKKVLIDPCIEAIKFIFIPEPVISRHEVLVYTLEPSSVHTLLRTTAESIGTKNQPISSSVIYIHKNYVNDNRVFAGFCIDAIGSTIANQMELLKYSGGSISPSVEGKPHLENYIGQGDNINTLMVSEDLSFEFVTILQQLKDEKTIKETYREKAHEELEETGEKISEELDEASDKVSEILDKLEELSPDKIGVYKYGKSRLPRLQITYKDINFVKLFKKSGTVYKEKNIITIYTNKRTSNILYFTSSKESILCKILKPLIGTEIKAKELIKNFKENFEKGMEYLKKAINVVTKSRVVISTLAEFNMAKDIAQFNANQLYYIGDPYLTGYDDPINNNSVIPLPEKLNITIQSSPRVVRFFNYTYIFQNITGFNISSNITGEVRIDQYVLSSGSYQVPSYLIVIAYPKNQEIINITYNLSNPVLLYNITPPISALKTSSEPVPGAIPEIDEYPPTNIITTFGEGINYKSTLIRIIPVKYYEKNNTMIYYQNFSISLNVINITINKINVKFESYPNIVAVGGNSTTNITLRIFNNIDSLDSAKVNVSIEYPKDIIFNTTQKLNDILLGTDLDNYSVRIPATISVPDVNKSTVYMINITLKYFNGNNISVDKYIIPVVVQPQNLIDIEVEKIDIPNKDEIYVGGNYKVLATIKNTGNRKIVYLPVRLYFDDTIIDNKMLMEISPGEEKTIELTFSPTHASVHNITVAVPTICGEVNIENNIYTTTVEVKEIKQNIEETPQQQLSTPSGHAHAPHHYPGVAEDIKSLEIKRIVYNSKLILGSEVDAELSAKELKDTYDLINKPLDITEDTILIGGPVANPLTKKFIDKFSVKITNNYPGKNRGVIQKITLRVKVDKNIYRDVTVILLAGSDRWGTKAAVEYFKQLEDIPEEPIFVEWKDGKPIKIEKP